MFLKIKFTFIDGYKSSTNITSLEYKISIPYSIPSDGKDYTVKVKELSVPVEYVYYAIPKLDKDVFVITEIKNWTNLKLLSGDASIYYKGIYTGQSKINANSTADTLKISLNRDKSIIIERALLKEKNEKQFIGKNIKETMNWSIKIKNNKSTKAKLVIIDQFPISENKSVKIEQIESSNGKINNKTGQVIWEFKLNPNEKKELLLKYSVKYPKTMQINVE